MASPSDSLSPASTAGRRFVRAPKRGVSSSIQLLKTGKGVLTPHKLRNGTFIIPGTGERVRRQINLRAPPSFDGTSPQPHDVEDFYFSGDGSDSLADMFRAARNSVVKAFKDSRTYLKTPEAKAILKCSLAYLLGSMATFLPPVTNLLGHQDGKHMVATITVYFHPARSAGSMVEATMLGIAAFCYALFISVSSMAVSVLCDTKLNRIELGYALILIVFCGGGLGFIGWLKQKFNAPLVNVACSLASLAIITVLTKENAVQVGVFSNDKVVQVMKMILLGICSTSAVSLLLWPVSARAELRETMIRATGSFAEMLTMITQGFLSGSENELQGKSVNRALSQYNSVFTQLSMHLKEAKLEHYVLGTEDQYKLEARLVNCMQTLAQSIGGLRSAATTQFTLLLEGIDTGSANASNHTTPTRLLPQGWGPTSPLSGSRQDRFAVLTAIEERSEDGSGAEDQIPATTSQAQGLQTPRLDRRGSEESISTVTSITVRTPGDIFCRFILHLGPSMKSLAYSLSQILNELPFGPGPDYEININSNFRTSLDAALILYSDARAEALKELYKIKELDTNRPASIEADFEEVAASCGQFSFSLYDFGSELQHLLSILEDLKAHSEQTKNRSWKWLRFWHNSHSDEDLETATDIEREPLMGRHQRHRVPIVVLEPAEEEYNSRRLTTVLRWKKLKAMFNKRLFHLLRIIKRDDVRFALKVGIGATLYALFAFIPGTRSMYQHWRGEWGLLSYMLVCSMTIGASNTTGWARFIGTFIGAILAIIVWSICQSNPFALAFCGWLVSLPCFYIIIAKRNGPFGRFIMLTYNISCLYAYSLSISETDDDDDEGGKTPFMVEIAWHRVVAVLAGVIWGLFITRVIWPISARRKLRDGLSLLWLRMGLIWKRDPLSTLLEGESQNAYMNLSEEMALQRYILDLDKLRSSASSEFELRGPFPSKQYGRIMDSTNKMLEAFHAMNVVIQKDPIATPGEAVLLRYTAEERARLCARISHMFHVLTSSMKLEYSLNNAIPNTVFLRDKLLAKIYQYRKDVAGAPIEEDVVVAKDQDYEILYSFTLVTGLLAREIRKIQREVEGLFGVLDDEALELH